MRSDAHPTPSLKDSRRCAVRVRDLRFVHLHFSYVRYAKKHAFGEFAKRLFFCERRRSTNLIVNA